MLTRTPTQQWNRVRSISLQILTGYPPLWTSLLYYEICNQKRLTERTREKPKRYCDHYTRTINRHLISPVAPIPSKQITVTSSESSWFWKKRTWETAHKNIKEKPTQPPTYLAAIYASDVKHLSRLMRGALCICDAKPLTTGKTLFIVKLIKAH